MVISGLSKTTLLDYPEHLAATVFTGGCNFRCPFCHNRDLVFLSEGMSQGHVKAYTEEEILAFLKKRRTVLSGVCITGGEPTLQPDLTGFIQKIKSLGYLVKLDTNGARPDILKSLLQQQLLDYVAVDIKNSPQKYPRTIGMTDFDISSIKESVNCLLAQTGNVNYEFRTTLVKEFHEESDIHAMCQWIQGTPHYFLQSFEDSGHLVSQETFHPHTDEVLQHFLSICRSYIPNTGLRT